MTGTWLVESVCFTVRQHAMFTGDEAGLRAYLDGLSRDGWRIASVYAVTHEEHAA